MKNEVMLDGFNDVIALDDMDCKQNLAIPTEQERNGQSICFLITWVLIGDYWATSYE